MQGNKMTWNLLPHQLEILEKLKNNSGQVVISGMRGSKVFISGLYQKGLVEQGNNYNWGSWDADGREV
jgi:hypothetical protein